VSTIQSGIEFEGGVAVPWVSIEEDEADENGMVDVIRTSTVEELRELVEQGQRALAAAEAINRSPATKWPPVKLPSPEPRPIMQTVHYGVSTYPWGQL